MLVKELVQELGGPRAVAGLLAQLGQSVEPKAVSMWGTRDEVPGMYHVVMWRLAVQAGIEWRPPGCDGLVLMTASGDVAHPVPEAKVA